MSTSSPTERDQAWARELAGPCERRVKLRGGRTVGCRSTGLGGATRQCPSCLRVAAITIALTAVREEAEAHINRYLISCPWCGEEMNARPFTAQLLHLITHGDEYRRGIDPAGGRALYQAGYQRGRAEMVEEAAKVVEEWAGGWVKGVIVNAIRALLPRAEKGEG